MFTWLHGYPASAGGKVILIGNSPGPASYTSGAGNGLVLYARQLRSIDMVISCETLSGSYNIQAQPATKTNPVKWYLRFFYAAVGIVNGATFTAGSGQTNGTYVLAASSGSATITIVIAGGVITSATVTNPGSGYTSAPTFTVSAGGTPGTVTATITSNTTLGGEVNTGANLSGETVQVGLIGG